MKILKNNLMRNLTLIGAGAFMATLVVLPITTNAADNDDDGTKPEAVSAATYTLGASDGTSAVFTLVENDGSMVLTLVEEPTVRDFAFNDDD